MPACSMKSRARGLSLIEVVIGMALLGLFLASIFIAQARLTRQSALIRKKALAISATDALLASWAMDWGNLPTDGSGTIPEHENLQWETQSQDASELQELGIIKVQLTITDADMYLTDEPILQLELAVPLKKTAQDEQPDMSSTSQLPAAMSDQVETAREEAP